MAEEGPPPDQNIDTPHFAEFRPLFERLEERGEEAGIAAPIVTEIDDNPFEFLSV